MNTRLFAIGLLTFISFGLLDASALTSAATPAATLITTPATIVTPPKPEFITLEQIQNGFASQPTHVKKAEFINSILDANASIGQKLSQAQLLLTIISHELSLYTGWLYNENQPYIDWLYEQQTKINDRIAQLQWQAKSYGEQKLWQAAKFTTIYLGIVLAYYLAQNQIKIINPNYKSISYEHAAWVPIEQVLNVAKHAVIGTVDIVTGETAQDSAKALYDFSIAAGKKTAKGVGETASYIIDQGKNKLQNNAHEIFDHLANATTPPQPPREMSPQEQEIAYKIQLKQLQLQEEYKKEQAIIVENLGAKFFKVQNKTIARENLRRSQAALEQAQQEVAQNKAAANKSSWFGGDTWNGGI